MNPAHNIHARLLLLVRARACTYNSLAFAAQDNAQDNAQEAPDGFRSPSGSPSSLRRLGCRRPSFASSCSIVAGMPWPTCPGLLKEGDLM